MAPDDDGKSRIYRDMCLGLDIAPLAGRRYLDPGWHEGEAELLGDDPDWWAPTASFRAFFGAESGILTVFWPLEQSIPAVKLATPLGPRWKFRCEGWEGEPCGRLTRRLLMPMTPPGITAAWRCRHCWGVRYRTARAAHRAALAGLPSVAELRRELDALERIRPFDRR